nr:VanZ family protein [Neobacillus sp. Marseille-Q6967]
MRLLLILLWAGAIFVFTCNSSFHLLVEDGVVDFQWNESPRFHQIFSPFPSVLSMDFLLQKIGHIIAFFILTILLQTRFNIIPSLLTAFFYAAATEFLQLYFTRNGRLFDIGFDTAGIFLAVLIASIFKSQPDSKPELHTPPSK